MSHPFEAFEIELPAGLDPAVLGRLEQELAQTTGVDQCGQSTARSLDPGTLTVWVTLAGSVVATAGAAVPVVSKIVELFRSKGIKGAKLVLADGSVLQADEISVADLSKFAGRP